MYGCFMGRGLCRFLGFEGSNCRFSFMGVFIGVPLSVGVILGLNVEGMGVMMVSGDGSG